MDACIFDSALSCTRRSDASEKSEENSVSTFGQIRLWTSFETSPVSVNDSNNFEPSNKPWQYELTDQMADLWFHIMKYGHPGVPPGGNQGLIIIYLYIIIYKFNTRTCNKKNQHACFCKKKTREG